MAGITLEQWEAGAPCAEDGLAFCARCKPSDLPDVVYTTSGGSAFHGDRACNALAAGQRKVVERGMEPSVITAVPRGEAVLRDMRPCLVCLADREAST